MSEKYKIVVEQEGVNHVKVFKADGNTYVNHWNFALKGDDEPIILKDFYTESRFAIVNWDGWIRLYDASSQTTIVDHKLNGKIDSSAVFSLDKTKLYVAYTDDSSAHLAMLNLNTYEIETLALPDIYQKSMKIRKDGCLLFYKHDWERIENKKTFKHFYAVLNLEDQKLNQFELAFAAQFSYGDFKPVIDITNNRAIMPLYDDVSNKTNASGEIVFEYKIALFDLNTFDLTYVLSVRDFPTNQLGYYESVNAEMTELFLGIDRNDDYADMQRDFSENLNTIKVVEDGMWLCWRGGIVRKVYSDLTLSPLLVTYSISDSTMNGLFNHGHFHSHLFHADNTTLILKQGNDFYKTAIPNFDHTNFETPIALHLEKTSLDEVYNLSYSKDQKNAIKNRDHIQIEVKDLSDKKSYMDGLLQIEEIVSDLKAAGIGSTLLFLIQDTKGKEMQEPEFFAAAVGHDPKRIQSIIEKFIQYRKAKYIYRNPEEPALCHAVFELAKQDEQYLKTVLQYLAAIDMDHDVFNIENTIPALEEKYTSKGLTKKMKAVSAELDEWYTCYCEG